MCVFRNISFYRKKFCDFPRESLWPDHCLLSGISETQTPKEGGLANALIFGDTLIFFLIYCLLFSCFHPQKSKERAGKPSQYGNKLRREKSMQKGKIYPSNTGFSSGFVFP